MTSSKDSTGGHRKRLRERFLKGELDGFADYEVIELLLSLGTPRKDVKPQAKEALKRFKTLRGVLSARPEELQQINGIGPHSVFGILLVQAVAREFLKERILDKHVYQSAQEIFDYLYHSMRDLKNEVFKVIYLTGNNQIIDTVDLFEGTVTGGAVVPRQVMESALEKHAASLIFVHNHPSGDCEPSKSDKELTRDLVFAGSVLGIKVLDHIIIGNDKYYSFAGEGLLVQYELDYLGLRMKGVSEAKRKFYQANVTGEDKWKQGSTK
ncbi:MAG: DNA repair protein RadC [Dehalococcoidia bacterium]|nr:DNA repair protein RadC [Dehalococcoidia bacterium]